MLPVRGSATLSKRTPKQTTVANSNPSHASKSGLETPTSDLPIRLNENELIVMLKEIFNSERGRIYCSLRTDEGKWRWLGIQYVVAEY